MRAYHIRIVLRCTSPSKSKQADTFIPLSLWQPLPTHPHKSTARRNATFNPCGKNYRFGPIALDWIDLDNMSSVPFVSEGRADPKGASATYLALSCSSEIRRKWFSGPAIATFVPRSHTKSGSTNLPDGVVHVFRDIEQQKLAETNEGTSTQDASRVIPENADSDGYMVGVLAVPSWMTPSDFVTFQLSRQHKMVWLI
jgi:BRCA1-associated protein